MPDLKLINNTLVYAAPNWRIPFALLFIIFHFKLLANPILIGENFTSRNISNQFETFIDTSRDLTVHDLLSDQTIKYESNHQKQISFRRQPANIWLKLKIRNITDSSSNLVLQTKDIYTRYLYFYTISDSKVINTYQGGLGETFHDRVIPNRHSAIPVNISPKSDVDVFIKIDAKWDPVQYPVILSEAKKFHKDTDREYLILGLLHGMLLLMVLIAASLYAATKLKLFLYYFFYSFFIFSISFCASGLDYQFIYPNSPVVAHHSKLFVGMFTVIFFFAFVLEFFKHEKEDIEFATGLFKIFIPLAILSLVLIAFQDDLRENSYIGFLLFVPGTVNGLVSLYIFYVLSKITWKNPIWINVVFFMGYAGTAAFGVFSVFINNGVIQLDFEKFTILRICLFFEMICLSILMLHKIFLLRNEKLKLNTEIKIARLEKEKADKIKELDQAKTRLYTNITHEFRTPLTVIKGLTEQIDGHPEQKKSIERNSNILLRLINQMLDLSKAEKGELKLNLIQNDIIQYVRYLCESFNSWAGTKNIQLHFSSEIKECKMDYDPEKLQDILSNLLSNAIKHTPEEKNIYISIKKEINQHINTLIVTVKDEGKGIAAEHLPYIFNRFYQVDQTDTRSDVGSGIGLALCQELVGLMNGKINVKSKLNIGSEFSIKLPIANKAPLQIKDAEKITYPTFEEFSDNHLNRKNELKTGGNRPLILVVEDNADVREYIAFCLKNDYQLLMAENGKTGIEKALEHSPDLILSDIMMPEINGLQLCHHLKTNLITSHIPIILLTAKADQSAKLDGLSRGADAYLAKPFDKKELTVRIGSLIEQRRRIQKHFLHSHEEIKKEEFAVEHEFLQKIKSILEENISDEHFDVQSLSRTIGMSRSQLYRKVKSLTGRSIAGYVRYLRLEAGKQLLESSDKTISEIAYEVGFSDLSYFSKSFSEEFGLPPKVVRRR